MSSKPIAIGDDQGGCVVLDPAKLSMYKFSPHHIDKNAILFEVMFDNREKIGMTIDRASAQELWTALGHPLHEIPGCIK